MYKVQKWIKGFGWSTVGMTPIEAQAMKAVEAGRALGYRMRYYKEA